MLRLMRAFARSWFGPLIMGSLMVAFLFLGGGVRDVLRGHIANAVVQAGGHAVSSAEFQKIFNNDQQAYLQKTGQPLPLDEVVKEGIDKGMLQDLALRNAYLEMLSQSGIRPPRDVVVAEILHLAQSGNAEMASLFDPVTGKFRQEALQGLLRDSGLTQQEFEAELDDSIADQDFRAASEQGFEIPRIYAAAQAALLLESRDVTYFVIPAKGIAPPPPPTDAQLNALIDQYRDQLTLPERRKLTIVRFSAKALAPTMPVDPAAVQQEFDAKKATYGKPETRSLVEIPLSDPSKAAQVQAALNAGQDPAAVAKSIGVEAVSYTDQPQSAIADRKAADVAFSMSAGQVSGPVQGDFKTVILKVISITPGQAPDFNTAKAQIVAELQMSEAQSKALDLSNQFDDLRQGGASIPDAAAKLGLTPEVVGPVTPDGKDATTGQPIADLTPKLLTAAFQLAANGDSDVMADADKGEYFAVHVDQIVPSGPRGLDEPGVRQMLTGAYVNQAIIDALKKKAADAQAALQKGQTFEAVAPTYGATVAHQLGMTRGSAQQLEATLGRDFLAAAFDAKPGEVVIAGSDKLGGMVVARLDAVHPGDPKQVATVLELVRQRSSQPYLEGLQETIHQAALVMIKPQTDLDLARNVMGIDADTVARATRGTNAAARPAS